MALTRTQTASERAAGGLWPAGVFACLALVGVMGGLLVLSGSLASVGQAASQNQTDRQAEPVSAEAPAPAAESSNGHAEPRTESPVAAQGPAVETPREVFEMLEQRKRMLDKKEEAVRVAEARLSTLKSEIEQLLARHEQAVKAFEATQKTVEQKQTKAESSARQAELGQLAKIYETMPPEEAALRIEKMPQPMALQLLRLLKGKTAGAILAQVKPEKAAKLTAHYLEKP
ncbi:MAG: hypothetical protein EPO64_06790 [Nitrospirae bacterium]|nr:MAG: hypothetical protein EPO64_06790 [Nitrospirota bacterium]